jgi:hypothetical protein
LFPEKYPSGDIYANFLSTVRDGTYFECKAFQAKICQKSPKVLCPDGELRENLGINADYTLDKATYPGLCIGTLISLGKPPAILGFHLAGEVYRGRATLLTRTDLVASLDILSEIVSDVSLEAHSGGDIPVSILGVPIIKGEYINHRHPLCYLESPGAVEVFGSTGVTVKREKSSVIVSPISGLVTELLGVRNIWGPPPLRGLDNKSSWRKWEQAFTHMIRPCMSFDPDLLHRATDDYLSPLLQLIREGNYDDRVARPLSDRDTVNGIVGMRFIDRMNMQTSMGFPLSGSKKLHLVDHVDGEGKPYQLFEQQYHDAAAEAEQVLLSGTRANFIYKACAKDEVIEQGKDKVRIFEAAPLIEQLLVRKYGLPVARFLSTHTLLSECAVGVNCYSREWDELCEHITAFKNNKILAGDYSKYDLRMSAQLILQAFKVLITLARQMGYTRDEIYVFQGLATEVANPLITLDGVLALYSGCNPSGHNLTVYINSIVNSLLLRMTFFTLYPHLQDFRKYSHVMTYGDDVCAGVSDEALDFSIKAHSIFMQKHGIVFTLPDKTSELVDHLSVEDTDFLKRRLVYREELQRWQAPIEYDSIMKSLHCLVRSNSVGTAEQSMQCMNSALRELFLHGKQEYEKHRIVFNTILEIMKWQPFKGSIFHVTYDEFLRLWLDDTELIILDEEEEILFTSQAYDYGYHEFKSLDEFVAYHTLSGTNVLGTRTITPRYWLDSPISEYYRITKNEQTEYEATGSPKFLINVRGANTRYNSLGVDSPIYEAQSDEGVTIDMCEPHTQEGLLQFTDDNPGSCAVPLLSTPSSSVSNDNTASISRYLSRPVVINTVTWQQGGTTVDIFDVWQKFLNNATISNKINNYSAIRGTLYVKFVVNGNGWYYGKWIAAYDPMHWWSDFSGNEVYPEGWTYHTQKNHIVLDAGSSSSATLVCPFIHYYDYLDLTSNDELINMGSIIMGPLNPLQHAGGSTSSLNITMLAWMENAELVFPTSVPVSGLVSQSDEYSKDRVSGIASAVAKSMGMLSQVPIIGPFALASSMVIGTIGKVAALFGYSKPRQIEDITLMQPVTVGDICSFDRKDTSVTLALDSKQEVTIDPRVAGFGNIDELHISTLVGKRTYLTTFTWTGDQAPNSLLWNSYISPRIVPTFTAAPNADVACYQTPLSALARLFGNWRGDIEFTLQVVTCAMFKGRLLVTWDPVYDVSGRGKTHLQYSHILDIAHDTEVTYKIGWGSTRPWLSTGASKDINVGQGSEEITFSRPDTTNGVLTISVISALTGISSTTASATINVWVNGASNFEFANPRDDLSYYDTNQTSIMGKVFTLGTLSEGPLHYNYLRSQSAEYDMGFAKNPSVSVSDPQIKVITFGKSTNFTDNSSVVCFGESIVSLRQLLKRYSYHRSIDFVLGKTLTSDTVTPSATTRTYTFQLTRRNLPYFNGNTGASTAYSYKRGPTIAESHFVHEHMINFLLPAFVGYRGSVRWKYYHMSPSSNRPGTSYFIDAARIPHSACGYTEGYATESRLVNCIDAGFTALSMGTGSLFSGAGALKFRNLGTFCGAVIKPGTSANVIEVELPYQTNKKFVVARRKDLASTTSFDDPTLCGGLVVRGVTSFAGGTNGVMSLSEYVAAGDDFSLFGFTGFPPVYPVKDTISSI